MLYVGFVSISLQWVSVLIVRDWREVITDHVSNVFSIPLTMFNVQQEEQLQQVSSLFLIDRTQTEFIYFRRWYEYRRDHRWTKCSLQSVYAARDIMLQSEVCKLNIDIVLLYCDIVDAIDSRLTYIKTAVTILGWV